MKEISFSKIVNGTEINGFMRILGRFVYLKTNNSQYSDQIIGQLRQRGARVEPSRTGGWMKVDMFANVPSTLVKIGNVEFEIDKTPEDNIEYILAEFYYQNYVKAGFTCQVRQE